MTTTNSKPTEQWTAFGAFCLFAASSVTVAAPQNTAFTTQSVYFAHGQILPVTDTSANGYIERIRKNSRRKAAMDRASAKLADRLNREMGAETFASLRLKHGFTQSELAKKTGLRQSYLSRIENNRCTISNETADKLAAAFGIDGLAVRAALENQWDFLGAGKA